MRSSVGLRIVFVFACALFTCRVRAGEIEWRDQYEYDQGDRRAHVNIAKIGAVARRDNTVEIDFCFEGNWRFYNPLLRQEIPIPARLVVFDSVRRYRCDMEPMTPEAVREPGIDDWIEIDVGSYLGRMAKFKLDRIPPGKYFLQLVFDARLTSPVPYDEGAMKITKERLEAWKNRYSHHVEVLRSNAVEFSVSE